MQPRRDAHTKSLAFFESKPAPLDPAYVADFLSTSPADRVQPFDPAESWRSATLRRLAPLHRRDALPAALVVASDPSVTPTRFDLLDSPRYFGSGTSVQASYSVDLETGEVQHLHRPAPAELVGPYLPPVEVGYRPKRQRLYTLRDTAAALAPDQRVCLCGKRPTSAAGVSIVRDTATKKAAFDGVQTCGSVWHCPVCAAKITEHRRQDMGHLVDFTRSGGGAIYMLTLTAPHAQDHALADCRRAMSKTYRYLVSGKNALPKLVDGYLGAVRATELTHGKNGWHLHYHVLLVVAAPLDPLDLYRLECGIFERWRKGWKRHGLEGTGTPTRQNGVNLAAPKVAGDYDQSVTDYICKWGVAEEMTKLHTKSGRSESRTPWQLLEAAQVVDIEDPHQRAAARRDRALWREYAKAMKGARQLVWSDGLRALVGLKEEVSDEEVAAALPEQPERVRLLSPLEWRALRVVGSLAVALDHAEDGRGDLAGYLADVVQQFAAGGGSTMPQLERRARRQHLERWNL